MKKWLGISMASMMAIGMAGCSSGNTDNAANTTGSPNNASPAPSSQAKQALTIWDWTDPYADQYKKPMDIVLAKYKQENPNVELNIEKITNDDMRTKLLAAASADNLPDVAYLASFPLWMNSFRNGVRKTISRKQYGIPSCLTARHTVFPATAT
jgi:multiple sugar transport system substrate-binding protein